MCGFVALDLEWQLLHKGLIFLYRFKHTKDRLQCKGKKYKGLYDMRKRTNIPKNSTSLRPLPLMSSTSSVPSGMARNNPSFSCSRMDTSSNCMEIVPTDTLPGVSFSCSRGLRCYAVKKLLEASSVARSHDSDKLWILTMCQ